MAQRLKLGLVFSNNDAWIGGTYYILNLIQALNTLSDEQKPYLIIFCDKKEDEIIIQKVAYPYLSFSNLFLKYNFFERVVNKATRLLLKKNIITKQHPKNIADVIFPFDFQESLNPITHKIAWIPDFQEHFLSHFFSQVELQKRKEHHLKIIEAKLAVIFSSGVAENHFHTIYPNAQNDTFILNFAVSHPKYLHIKESDLLRKYDISKKYFIAPNQFWIHKNHQAILEAIKHLKETYQEIPFQVVLTGKEYDFRYPEYTENLKKFVENNHLQEDILFLGFIDRAEQLKLMKEALAVIQPSLFEGWSTVVEDAKAMNQMLILSDIDVHQEQVVTSSSLFFHPKDFKLLAQHLMNTFYRTPQKQTSNYLINIKNFGENFLSIISKIITQNIN
ncbi:MAG: glycosyltransferase [Thermonemataceae bacterium]|nr:glycosyltransferase [Thermonemataceae bacterium]